MKTILNDACRKCGSTLWYVHRSGRRCVPCAHGKAMIGRAEVKRLQARVRELEALLIEALPAMVPAAAGHNYKLGIRFDCPCVRCRVEYEAARSKL